LSHEVLRHRVAETGGAAGDDRLDLIELHVPSLSMPETLMVAERHAGNEVSSSRM
jgi:hypothetical protein